MFQVLDVVTTYVGVYGFGLIEQNPLFVKFFDAGLFFEVAIMKLFTFALLYYAYFLLYKYANTKRFRSLSVGFVFILFITAIVPLGNAISLL